MGQDDRTGFFSWEWFMALDQFNPLKWIGLASTRAGCRPACLETEIGEDGPLALNDHLVPPVDAVLSYFCTNDLVTGSSPLFGHSTWGTFCYMFWEHGRFGLGPRHLTGVNHTGVYP
ncbi:hypothetical protein PIB30_075304 [Stylosanthes scabra]|uniref:Uncharacterized protein n=1 Tax=Stylosanthes scabra TaxID=79078 RepID=A0ABU6UNS1_9FABA|nr:hypothetical protein [Stylosanthes scabra]